ncbi:MAG: FAD:protein FMN transferase [Ktedonobacterales bacterium]
MRLSADQPRVLVQRASRPMATEVSVQISTSKEQVGAAEGAADACMSWFEEVDLRLSRFRPESELCTLNRAAGRWFAASPLLYAAVGVALQSARSSCGRFDPTLLPQIEALGYDRDFAQIAQRETAGVDSRGLPPSPPLTPEAWRGIELDPANRRIRLPEHVRLDLGGIAKGWAADVALHRFCLSFAGALINVGGDLRVHGGPAAGDNWSVGIRDPRREQVRSSDSSRVPGSTEMPAQAGSSSNHVALLSFSRGGLATSGALRRWWLQGGKRQHHLLNPQTGSPIELWIDDDNVPLQKADAVPLIATATALAPTAARAEVAAKVALLRGYPSALHAVEAAWERPISLGGPLDADTAVALVLSFGTGEVAVSGNLEAYLATWGTEGVRLPTSADF